MGAIVMRSIVKEDNLGSGGNTSSIMLCNGASIIHREGPAATFG
jgi:hypothetical protein